MQPIFFLEQSLSTCDRGMIDPTVNSFMFTRLLILLAARVGFESVTLGLAVYQHHHNVRTPSLASVSSGIPRMAIGRLLLSKRISNHCRE
jgi:hypothetical protein